MFYELLLINEGKVTWNFWNITQEDLTTLCGQYNLAELQDSPPPYRRSLKLLETFMVTLQSYLSSGNLHTPADAWVVDVAGGNKEAERDQLITDFNSEDGSIPVVKDVGKVILSSAKWLGRKVVAGESLIAAYNRFRDLKTGLDNVINRIIQGEISKDEAVERTTNVITALNGAVDEFIAFYAIEPDQNEFQGLELMFGEGCIKNGVTDVDLGELINEASLSDPVVGLRVNETLGERRDLHLLDNLYAEVMQIFSDIKGIVNKDEDEKKLVSRLRKNIEREAQELANDVYTSKPIESVSVVTDLIKQLDELKKKMSNLTSLTDDLVTYNQVYKLTESGSAEPIQITDFVRKAKSKLLLRKDELFLKQREDEAQQKATIQQILRSAPSDDLMSLTSRREIVPFLNNFKELRERFKKHKVPDWRTKLLKMGKKSMKIESDKKATRYMDSLAEFESYLKVTHVSEMNLIQDLMSDLKDKAPPTNVEESIPCIQESLLVLETIKKKKLGPKFTDRDLEDILKHSLTRKDRDEYRRAYAKEKVDAKLITSTVLESDSDSDKSIDWDATIREEVADTNLDQRRKFLTKFLTIKLIQLKDIERGRRTLEEDKKKPEVKKSLRKVRFKDKIFLVGSAANDDSQTSDSDSETELANSFEELVMFAGKPSSGRSKDRKERKKDSPSKYKKKPCPIKCPKLLHSNGSLYFCPTFRGKSKEERRMLQKKCHLCITCLSKCGPGHQCPIGPCKACGAAHNILLCTKEPDSDEKVFLSINKSSSDESDSEDLDGFRSNSSEAIYAAKTASVVTSTPKGERRPPTDNSTKSEPKGGSKDGKGDNMEEEQKAKLGKVKDFLRNLVEVRSCASSLAQTENENVNFATNFLPERAYFMQCGLLNTAVDSLNGCGQEKVISSDEGDSDISQGDSLYGGDTDDGGYAGFNNDTSSDGLEWDASSEQSHSSIKTDTISSQEQSPSELNISSTSLSSPLVSGYASAHISPASSDGEDSYHLHTANDSKVWAKKEKDSGEVGATAAQGNYVPTHSTEHVEQDHEMPGLTSSSESDNSDSEESSSELDDDLDVEYNSKVFLMTSVSNLRRREELGIKPKFMSAQRKSSKPNKPHKIPSNKEQTVPFEKLQEFLKKELRKDGRGIKEENPRKSIFSTRKWGQTERWEEILEEGNKRSDLGDSVRLIHEPNLPSKAELTSVTEGWKKLTVGPANGGELFRKLISTATEAFRIVSKGGRNMSSMITPITLLGDPTKVDVDLAKSLGIKTKESSDGLLLELEAVVDTGADSCVSEKAVRKILGREELPDARTGLLGVGGIDPNRDRDKIRIVSSEGLVCVTEARIVANLGPGPPDSPDYITATKCEFGIKEENEHQFNYSKEQTNPRVLIGLRSGNLLAKKLEHKDILLNGWEIPLFSPDLQMWKTPLNEQLIISGTVGVNPLLIEMKSNYPRFDVIVKDGATPGEIIEMVETKSKNLLDRLKEVDGKESSACFFTSDKDGETMGDNDRSDTDNFQNLSPAELDHVLEMASDDDRVYMSGDEILIFSSTNNSENFLLNPQLEPVVPNSRSFYAKADSESLQKFLLKETNHAPTIRRKCMTHRARCEACDILNMSTHHAQSDLMLKMWDNVTATEQPDGTYQIYHKYCYRHDPKDTYRPENSNVIEAAGHSRRTVQRAVQNKSLDLLTQQVDKMVSKGIFKELSDEEIINLGHRPHNFCMFNHVFNDKSVSTPYRMISNTSAVSAGTTISVEMMTPKKVLNSQVGSLIRFRLYPIGLAGDIKSAYHTILVDLESTYLRLFFWWADLPQCKKAKIYRQLSQSFGDPGASCGLELAILKFIVTEARLDVTKFICEYSRYADNLTFSVESSLEYFEIKEDLVSTFKKYRMDLKYVVTDIETDPKVLQDSARGSDPSERLLGVDWCLLTDTINVSPQYSLFGSRRGARLGPLLTQMSETDIIAQPITRLTFLRLTAQSYNRMQDILGPLIISIKALASRSCELASLKEMELDLSTRDEEFVKIARTFILNLRKVREIEPFRRAWIPKGHKLMGFAVAMDGAKLASGTLVHSLTQPCDGTNKPLDRTVCMSKSAIGKRNIVAHESLSAPLAGDALDSILDSLKFDFYDYPFEVHFLSDSTCFLAMLNPMIDLKNTLFSNCVNYFKEKIMGISAQFKNVRITIGYVATDSNAADTVSKVLLDPIPVVNSPLYRIGPAKYDSLESLREDTVAKVSEKGEFVFMGIPERFLPADSTEGKCLNCRDNCWMARTRSKHKKELEDARLSSKEASSSVRDERPTDARGALKQIRQRLVAVRHFSHLLNPHEILKSCFVMDKATYDKALGSFFTLPKMLQFCSWVTALDLAKNGIHHQGDIIKRESFGLLMRTSQTHYKQNLEKLGDVKIDGIRFMSLRLQPNHTELFNTNFLPVVGSNDPLRFKFIRHHHLMSYAGLRTVHANKKSTTHLVSQGAWAVTWHKKKGDVSKFIDLCGSCNRMNINTKATPPMGPSYNRVFPSIFPFTHISIDPLGFVPVKLNGSVRGKAYPLILMDINNGNIGFEILKNLEAKEVYLALCRLEWRYGTSIYQIYSDKGSQLSYQLLGKKTDFYQQKLGERWGVFNNEMGCQFRNLCERKVQSAKRVVKQALSGRPGVIRETPTLSYLETILCMVANVVNRVPYAVPGNTRLLCPMDTLAPWQVRDIPPRELPGGKLSELVRTQQFLMALKEQIKTDLTQEFADETRLASNALRLGTNKRPVIIQKGDVIQIKLGNAFEVGVVTNLVKERHAEIRLSSGRIVETSVANLTQIAMGSKDKTPREFTHFVSMEMDLGYNVDHAASGTIRDISPFLNPIKEYQDMLRVIKGVGTPMESHKLHVTMCILNIQDRDGSGAEMEQVKTAIAGAMREWKDLISKDLFYIGASGLEIFTAPCGRQHVVTEVKLGRHGLALLRGTLFERLQDWISDKTWRPHITVFKNSSLSDEDQRKIVLSTQGVSFGIYGISCISLRKKKALAVTGEKSFKFSLTDEDCRAREF